MISSKIGRAELEPMTSRFRVYRPYQLPLDRATHKDFLKSRGVQMELIVKQVWKVYSYFP